MSAVAEDLRRVRARLERGWTQGAYARTPEGAACGETDSRACRWCLSGALFAEITDALGRSAAWRAIEAETPDHDPGGGYDPNAVTYNDLPTTTKEDVLALVDRAIAGRP